jgi:transposase
MEFITGRSRNQIVLVPDSIEEYVGEDKAVRVIEAYINGLDLESLKFSRPQPRSTGRPGYDPKDLLKLYVYGYLNRVRSSR